MQARAAGEGRAERSGRTTAATAAVVGFVVAFVVFLCAGVGALFALVDQESAPLGMACAERLPSPAHLPVVRIAMGSPKRTYSLLVVLESSLDEAATRLHADRVFDSATIACDERVCHDQLLLLAPHGHHGARRDVFRVSFAFRVDASAAALGLDGAVRVGRGRSVLVQRTRVCWALEAFESAESSAEALRTTIGIHGALATDVATARLVEVLADTPAATACAAASVASVVDLFPTEAADEASWLGLSRSRYEARPAEPRRKLVEASLSCTPNGSSYADECAAHSASACRTRPSVPLRRIAHAYDVQLARDANDSVLVAFAESDRPTHYETRDGQVFNSVVRLIVLVIVAFVSFSRASTNAASAPSVFAAAVHGVVHSTRSTKPTIMPTKSAKPRRFADQAADALVGGFALAARLAVLLFRFDELVADGPAGATIVGFELAGVVASAVAFAARVALVSPLPVTVRLGGSTALIDASQTAMLTVVAIPVGGVASPFDATLRFLAAALLSTFAIHRAIFASMAATTTALVALLRPRRFAPAFAALATLVALAWLAQLAALSVSLSVGFALPQSADATRASREPRDATAVAIFLAAVCAQLPFLNRSVVRLLAIL